MLVIQKTIIDRYFCIKSFFHLKNLENASKSSFLHYFMAQKSMKDSWVLKTLVSEPKLTSS